MILTILELSLQFRASFVRDSGLLYDSLEKNGRPYKSYGSPTAACSKMCYAGSDLEGLIRCMASNEGFLQLDGRTR